MKIAIKIIAQATAAYVAAILAVWGLMWFVEFLPWPK
jgi:hypothetical protein